MLINGKLNSSLLTLSCARLKFQIVSECNVRDNGIAHMHTCQLSRFSWESPSFSLNLSVSPNAVWVIFGGYSWTLSLLTLSRCKDF